MIQVQDVGAAVVEVGRAAGGARARPSAGRLPPPATRYYADGKRPVHSPRGKNRESPSQCYRVSGTCGSHAQPANDDSWLVRLKKPVGLPMAGKLRARHNNI
ncbi:unnamed protein product [Pieris brassicae]|uniref:Uncharacterized protein n=1 Tax=Pieris brassicae TaxID=7116 RepID=A0A9P0X8N9_PIEBR|nr:unnamed protein product [Pieris brassicae]